jgi:hypothetical protein
MRIIRNNRETASRCLDNGVTRATRIAELAPGVLIRIVVVGTIRGAVGHLPTIGGLLP